MEWYLKVMKQYADFSGRARRTEYWMFTLIYNVITYAIYFAAIVGMSQSPTMLTIAMGAVVVLSLVHFIPSLAVLARRLHDTDRSGWWFLIVFIPIIGIIVLIVFLCQDSVPGRNKWGPNPKNPDEDSEILDDVIDDIV